MIDFFSPRLRDEYLNDVEFHHAVDVLQRQIDDGIRLAFKVATNYARMRDCTGLEGTVQYANEMIDAGQALDKVRPGWRDLAAEWIDLISSRRSPLPPRS